MRGEQIPQTVHFYNWILLNFITEYQGCELCVPCVTVKLNQRLEQNLLTWHSFSPLYINSMNNFWKSLIAGYAGWKWGGGCLGFIVVFIIVFYLLGYIHC